MLQTERDLLAGATASASEAADAAEAAVAAVAAAEARIERRLQISKALHHSVSL